MTDETLFAAAMESPDRAAFLARACPDADQRGRVERLLAAHDRATGFLQTPAAPPRTQSHVEGEDHDIGDSLGFLSPSQRPDSLGRIGHYEVLEVLGRGGFGVVFRAFDDVLQRVVAVKTLLPSMAATSPARKRFLREARSSAAIRHDNVVQVHAVEEQPLPFIVMEFVPGESLQQRLDRAGPLDVAEVLRIGRQVAEGLAAAHATGVVHRDIKPANVLVEPGTGRVRITDFGLARAADDASLTRSGTVAGTPLYMAPEQARGEALDHRADLFSLGSVLYAVLTGRPPFRADTTLAVLKRVADDTPRPIREVIPEVPEWFCRIVEKLHAKNPADRFQTAREVAGVLADCEQQLAAHKELKDFSRIPGGRPRPRRPRLKWAAAGAVVLVGLVAWFGRPVRLYANDQGQLDILPGDGLVSVIVLHNDEGVIDGNKLHPLATDWLGMKQHHLLTLRPGTYQLNVGTYPAGTRVTHWYVTTSKAFGTSYATIPVRETSAIIRVERGSRVKVEPVMGRIPTPPDPPPAPPKPDATRPADSGFVSLFNGHDLTGWQEFPAGRGSWKVENMVLVGSGKASHLFTRRGDFANFHLRMECRVRQTGPKAGAVGVFARVPFENPKTFLSPHGREELSKTPVPKLYDAPPPDPAPPSYREQPLAVWGADARGEKVQIRAMPAGEWFTSEFVLDGTNGSLVTTIKTEKGAHSTSGVFLSVKPTPGHLALQLFDDWSVVEFRKIEIKELPAASPEVPKRAADILAFIRGTWKGDRLLVEPKTPADKARSTVHLTFEPAAGGKVMRGLGVDETGRATSIILHSYDGNTNRLSSWYFGADGESNASDAGAYDSSTRTFHWKERVVDGTQADHHMTFVDGNTVSSRHYDTDATSKLVFESQVAYTRTNQPPAAPKDATDPKRPSEMAALDRLVGEWRTELSVKSGADSPKAQVQQTKAASVLGGRFIEVTDTDEATGASDYSLAWYDAAKKQYRQWFFHASGYSFEMTGTWDEAAKTLTWASPDNRLGGRWVFKADGTREFLHKIKDGKGSTTGETSGTSRRAAAGQPQPVLLKRFDPEKDKPTLPWGDPKNVRPEDGGWRIENATSKGNFHAHLGTLTDALPTEGLVVFKAKVRVKANDKLTWGALRLGIGGPNFHGHDWQEELGTYRGDVPEWTQKELQYPASVFHKRVPAEIPVYVGVYSNGVVWVKDAEVWHVPVDPRKAEVLKPLRDSVAAMSGTLELTKKRHEAGTVSTIEVLRAEGDLIAARLAYSEAEGDARSVAERLAELVKARQEERDLVRMRVTAGVERVDVLNQADARLAEAKAKAKAAKAKP